MVLEHVSRPLETGDSHVLNAWSRGLLPCGLVFLLPSLYGPSVWRLTELTFSCQFSFTCQESLASLLSFAVGNSAEVGTGEACLFYIQNLLFITLLEVCSWSYQLHLWNFRILQLSSSEGKNLIHLLASYSELFIPRLFSIQDNCFKPPRERGSLSASIVA